MTKATRAIIKASEARPERIFFTIFGISSFLGYLGPWVFGYFKRTLRHSLGVWVLGYFVFSASAAPLDDRIKAFEDAAAQDEGMVSRVLEAGLTENRSALAFAAVKNWLSAHPELSQPVLMQAARAAERAGDWTAAASFYRKLLRNPSVDPQLAAEATPAVYRLLINQLDDADAAYLFMREDGARLRAFGRVRQFDAWFLNRAVERGDLIALAQWLTVIHNGDEPLEPFGSSLNALLGALETYTHDGDALFAALKELAAAKRTSPEMKARLQWVIEIVPFQAKVAALVGAKQKVPDDLLTGPLKASEALLSVLPYKGACIVADGWMHFNAGDSGVFSSFVIPGREAKSAQLVNAMSRMTPVEIGSLLARTVAFGKGRRVGDYLFSMETKRELVKKFAAVFNSLAAPEISIFDNTLTQEAAAAMAPNLARNPHLHAALVRAWALPERRASEVVARTASAEGWRFSDIKTFIDGVWNSGMFERDGKAEAVIKKHAAPGPVYDRLQKQVGKKTAGKDRIAAFQELQKDLLGAAPQIPGALSLWDDLFANASGEDAAEMLRVLVSDPTGDRTFLLRRAAAKASFGGHAVYWMPEWGDNFMANGPQRSRYQTQAAPLVASLQGLLSNQTQTGSLSEIAFGIWMHAADPADAGARDLMRKIAASPAYASIDPAYQRVAADVQHFGKDAMTESMLATNPSHVSRELMELPANAAPAQGEAALRAVIERLEKAPSPVTVLGLAPVAALPEWSPAVRAQVASLFTVNASLGSLPALQGYEALVERFLKDAAAASDWGSIEPLAAGFWRAAAATDDRRTYRGATALVGFAESAMAAGAAPVAMSIARIGLRSQVGRELAARTEGNLADLAGRLSRVAGRAAMEVGAVEIPVAENNPKYPLYKSNAEFVQGNLDTAWELFVKGAGELPGVIRSLSTDYGLWALERSIKEDKRDLAEQLIKELTIWSRQAEGTFSLEQDAKLKISYADLAFREGSLPTARAWYRKVADAAEYAGSAMYLDAALGSVNVDRVTKNYGAALTELDKLMRLGNPGFRMRVRYARAEVLMDQENYAEALAELEDVLRQEPKHPDALILRGQIHYHMRKLVEASEIELGPSQDDTLIVPGEAVKINLRDPTLRVSGVGADIEAEIRAKSGDVVRVLLHQLGDSKDKFRAEVPTELGAPNPNDKVLQVLGVDEIRFGYSERFRAKMDDLPADPDVTIKVASDAHLDLTAGAFPPREGERRLDVEELGISTAQAALGDRAVRPGNPVYLRVTDPDRSVSADLDEVTVTMQASSGDEIRRLVLKETSPFSGEFQAVVPTTGAQALAFASDSAPGLDPNMAVSALEYPGWQGEVGSKATSRIFGVDLNDNVALGNMKVEMGAAGERLTRFIVQTSMNGTDWTTRARFPEDEAPWDGRPQVTSIPTHGANAIPIPVPEGRELPGEWLEAMEFASATSKDKYLAAHVSGLGAKEIPVVNTGHPGYSGLIRIRMMFHQPAAAVRRFKLTGLSATDDKGAIKTIFLIDGKPAAPEAEDPMLIERELAPGLHEIQIWTHDGRADFLKRRPALLCDEPGKPELAPCADSMFDPTTFAEGVRANLVQPAVVRASADVGLDLTFGDRTQARLVRFVIASFEGVAPAVKKVTLTDRSGRQMLPVAQDYKALRENDQLEVLPGDRVAVRYEDPVSATPKRTRHEKSLGVAFNTGVISASFLNYETNKEGERVLKLEPIRRFRYDDAIGIVIDDADLDSSAEPDTVEFTVTTSDGGSVTLKAVETEKHSGQFIGRVFPVEGEPSRASEIKLAKGGTLTATYRDAENLDPGIPAERTVTISHARYVVPLLDAYAIDSKELPLVKKEVMPEAKPEANTRAAAAPEVFEPRRALHYRHVPAADKASSPAPAVIGADVCFEVVAPHLALAGSSEIRAYIQTEAARKAAGPSDKVFDVTVPGTLKLTGLLKPAESTVPTGYAVGVPPTPPTNEPRLEEGRFTFSVPLILGDPPQRSFATKSAEELPDSAIPDGLAVKAGDVVRIGFPWQDEEGKVQWKTASFTVGSHEFLDVMQNGYREPVTCAYVGEKIYLRLLAPGLDRGPERDVTKVSIKGTSGAATEYELSETEGHSGVFKGVFTVSYAEGDIPAQLPPVALNGFPVRYGDDITIAFDEQTFAVNVNKGADGKIEPFSKRFTGGEMAVQTGFTLAECYFELAKKHREMDQESLARREIGQARKLLAEALATHRDDNLKAHAEYLLGNLSQEFADLAKNDESKLPLYQDALARFVKIPADYPDSEFAPKAQFKVALVYEKMGSIENSVEEYVKLAYKYPKDELIPTVMSRLGGYFQSKGQALKEQADALRKKEDEASKAEVLRLDELSYPEFLNAAMVFSKLQERFPQDPLAGLAGLRAAQNFMRASQYEKAIAQFQRVIDNEEYDGAEIRSQAIYWCGISHERLASTMTVDNYRGIGEATRTAYQLYRRVTFDFPDSKWAKFARGRLADPVFSDIIRIENEERERMLESLKEKK